MAISKHLLEELQKRRTRAEASGGADKIKARNDKGQLSARQRLESRRATVAAGARAAAQAAAGATVG